MVRSEKSLGADLDKFVWLFVVNILSQRSHYSMETLSFYPSNKPEVSKKRSNSTEIVILEP